MSDAAAAKAPDSDGLDASKRRSRLLYEEVFGKGNHAAADELMAADIINHGPGSPPNSGTEGIKRQAALLRAAIPDLRVTLDSQVGEGDKVVSHWSGRGTHTGPLNLSAATVKPTGNPISFDEIRIDRHAGGYIAESWWIPDRFTLWAQLGLLPPPPGAAGPGARRAGGGTNATTTITDEYMREMLAKAKAYTIVLLKAAPGYNGPGADAIIWEHGRRQFSLRADGVLPVVCPVTDDSELAGVNIFDASAEEAAHIMNGDPAVKAGVLTYEVHPVRGFPGDRLPA